MIKDGYGTFGAHAKAYGTARQAFPKEVFEYLKTRAGTRTEILDMGCGTGIPSRQMTDIGFHVVGSDSDERMIEQAKIDSHGYTLEYVIAPARSQPFTDNSFDIVTAFSAFHWFSDDASLMEIQRVLVPQGLLFVMNKNEAGDMKRVIKNTLKSYIHDGTFPKDAKAVYDPAAILKQHGFDGVEEYAVAVTEEYTIDDAVLYAQSMSIWNLVVEQNRSPALDALRAAFASNAQNDIVLRPLEVKTISGYWRS